MGSTGNLTTATSAGCRLYVGADPSWDSGIFEEAIDQLNYPLVATYIGAKLDDWVAKRDEAFAAGHDVLVFYHWTPSKLLATPGYPNVMIQLPVGGDRLCGAGTGWSATATPRWCHPSRNGLKKIYSPSLREVGVGLFYFCRTLPCVHPTDLTRLCDAAF